MSKIKRILGIAILMVVIFISGCVSTQIEFTTASLVINDSNAVEIPVNSDKAVFEISNEEVLEISDGKIIPLNAGRATITIVGSTSTLDVIINPIIVCSNYLGEGESSEISLSNYDGNIHDFEFEIDNKEILSLDNLTLTAISKGIATITASLKEDIAVTSSFEITIGPKIPSIILSEDEIYLDDIVTLSVGNFDDQNEFIYTSSDEDILEVIGTSAFALKVGKVTITATSKVDSSIFGVLEVEIKALMPGLRLKSNDYKVGQTIEVLLSNYTDKNLFNWEVADPSIVSIDNAYNLLALKEGITTLTIVGKADKTLTTSIDITVYPVKPILSTVITSLQLGQKVKLEIINYTNKDEFTWQVGDSNIINIENYLAEAISVGSTTITVTSKSDSTLTDTITLNVIPILPILDATFSNMRIGDVGYLWISNADKIEGTFSDFNISISDNSVIKIEDNKITALKKGTVTVTATSKTNNLVTASYQITVTETSTSKTEDGEIAAGPLLLYTEEEGGKLHAGVMSYVYIDGANSSGNYNWVTAEGTIATVNDNGRIIAISEGTVLITAISKENKEVKGTINITVYGKPNVDYVSRLIAIANEEIGYVEGPNNDTKYGAWYNLNYEAWCAMFVSWCCYEAGISTKIVPRYCGCTAGMAWFAAENRFGARGEYTPQPGDIIFFRDADQSTGSTHTGIVIAVDETKVYTIEGNTSNMVAKRSYLLTNTYIVGYGNPNYPAFTNESGN
ncbi:MAG: CHAP domain-containing protein [Bacilli bacterium]|nr:CHAP domain-containing protein [Bacilli bacterium]